MKTVIVLAMHGMPPTDFPREELAELFRLHSTIETAKRGDQIHLKSRYASRHDKMRSWPRNERNDPFYAASRDLATHFSQGSGHEVVVGYNQFCAPTLDEALQSAADRNANKIVVVTPMMTRGGEHADKDIPAGIDKFRKLHPEIVYAWPFDTGQLAKFLSDHILPFA